MRNEAMEPQWSMTTQLLNADRGMYDESSVSPPLYQTTNYIAQDSEHFAEMSSEALCNDFYQRSGNPNSSMLVKVLAKLEGGETGMMFASGVGAMSAAVMAHVKAGDHIVAQKCHYIGTNEIVSHVLNQYGVEYTLVDQRSVSAFEQAIQSNTKLIVLETPVNPMMHITDLKAVCDLAKSRGILTICDNTFASPINQRPMELGVDMVMHSATKYIGGHHDLLSGAIIASHEIMERIWDLTLVTGAVAAPFTSWLALRGVRTLELRVKQQNTSTMAIAQFLEKHPLVNKVHYPGLASHAQHELASQQMSGFGGLLTFELKNGYEAGKGFIKKLSLVSNAPSLGGVFSVAIQPSVMFGGRLSQDLMEEQGITAGLIRFGVGIENQEDLLQDIEQALG